MTTTLETNPIVKWLEELKIPVTRQSFIDLNWGDNVPDPWNAEAEYEIPEELQDWSWLPHPGNPETDYASSDIPPEPPPDDDDDDDDLEDEEDADYGEDEDEEDK